MIKRLLTDILNNPELLALLGFPEGFFMLKRSIPVNHRIQRNYLFIRIGIAVRGVPRGDELNVGVGATQSARGGGFNGWMAGSYRLQSLPPAGSKGT